MFAKTHNPASGFKLVLALVAVLLLSGCVSAKTRTAEAVEPADDGGASTSTSTPIRGLLAEWVVSEGDNLWYIAGVDDVYDQSEQWPLLYKANSDQIEDADLIYPGQVLEVPRDSSDAEIRRAITHAKNRGAWAVGPVEVVDREYLRSN